MSCCTRPTPFSRHALGCRNSKRRLDYFKSPKGMPEKKALGMTCSECRSYFCARDQADAYGRRCERCGAPMVVAQQNRMIKFDPWQ